MNGEKSKLFDGFLILCERYLSSEVNLRDAEGIKWDGEDMLFRAS